MFQVYLRSAIWCFWARIPPKVDGFAPRSQCVNLRIVWQGSLSGAWTAQGRGRGYVPGNSVIRQPLWGWLPGSLVDACLPALLHLNSEGLGTKVHSIERR